MRRAELFVLLFAALGTIGCASRQIVSASPPASVSTPPPVVTAPAPPPVVPPPEQPTVVLPPEIPAPVPPPLPAKLLEPPRPLRPLQPEVAEPAPPKPKPPQISPQLSAKDLETAQTNTTSNITTTEKNLRQAGGKKLNATQKDLAEKISGFLSQAQEAIRADDWVRAQNLAEKARVLSVELVKSF
jgi:hypothetical protein